LDSNALKERRADLRLAPVTATISEAERAALQHRVLRVLTAGQIVGAAALGAAVTVGAFVVQDILGDETPWGGIATATVTTGTAVMAQLLSRLMWRQGRRPGLQLGYGLAAVGGITAAVGAERELLAVFIAGLFLFGSGQASNLLSRYAATDLADPDHRGRAMSHVVFASTFGAVFGPLLINPAQRAGEVWFGLERYTGPWLLGALCFAVASVHIAVRLRPDPLVVAGGLTVDTGTPRPPLRHTFGVIAAAPLARVALASMAVSQGTMVAVMTMTPVHMKLHGHESMSPYVISVHIGGMFAFSPLVGRFADRRGRIPAVLTGATILVASTLLASAAGVSDWLLFPALWGLGLGWNFGLIGGSALLSESVPAAERVGVQGTADLCMSLCGAVAGLSSGFVRRAVGYHVLADLAAIAAGVLLVVAYVASRRPPRTSIPSAEALPSAAGPTVEHPALG
jgi:MFS family permease